MSIYISILLICSWQIVNFLSQNLSEEVNSYTILVFFLVNVAVLTSFTFILHKMSGGKPQVLVVSFVAILFFYLTPGIRELSEGMINLRSLLMIEGLLTILFSFVISQMVHYKSFERAAFYLSSGLVCLSLAGMGANFIVAPTTEAPHPSPIQQKIAAPFKSKPNVYYIILDAYGREDQLRKQFGFDNSPMTTSLKKNGFKVLSNSYTAFPVTEYSVSSTLLMKPVLSASKKPYLDRFISPVFNRFRNAGYQIAVLDGRSCAHGAICLTNDGQGVGTFGNLVQNLLRLTVLYEVILKFAPYLYGDLRATVYDLQVILNEITFEQPTFIYAHIMFPHPPYTRNANCNVQFTDNLIDVEDFLFKSRDMYIDQLKCVNRQVINFLPDLLKRDPEAIIVLQSDHGPGFVYRENSQDTDFNFPDSKPWSQDALEERYAILNAWYFPAKCQRLLSDTMPTIDTFLVIFSCLQGTSFSPNKNESFWVDRTREMRVYKIRKGDDWLLKNQ